MHATASQGVWLGLFLGLPPVFPHLDDVHVHAHKRTQTIRVSMPKKLSKKSRKRACSVHLQAA